MAEQKTPPIQKTLKAMISSTVRDLPEHRKQVEDACHRMGVFAEQMMENLTAEDANAVGVSLRLVDQADIYIGIFAQRYGFVPEYDNPTGISITEMEYNRAVQRDIPRLIFFIHDDHDLKVSDVEKGEGAVKLEVLKKRIGNERVAAFFTSPTDLRAHVVQAISQLKEKWLQGQAMQPHQFHYVHPMTEPPEPYVAHPYTLLQAVGLIGRQSELNLLTDWITGKNGLDAVRIFNLIAIGGMGKSALTWHWFHNVAPLERPDLAGRFWWSFYESDAHFENFVIRALAYVGRMTVEEVKVMPSYERENYLLTILHKEPYLLILDGLDRILEAYTKVNSAYLADDEENRKNANWVASIAGLPESAAQSFTGEHRLRMTSDPRAGQFLKRLASIQASKVVISSRLYPFDLQLNTGVPKPGCYVSFLLGLSDEDALQLWHYFGVSGQNSELLKMFRTFEKHPLLLQALAGEIARWRKAPGNFDRWRKERHDFDPFTLSLRQVKSHILVHAMFGLNEAEQKILHTIAAFRMPAQYDTLSALLIGKHKPCISEQGLDFLLTELEDRGLIGWDRRANRYDMHPVVRGVVWRSVPELEKQEAYATLQSYFEAAPIIKLNDVKSLDDITPAIELFHALVGQKKFEAAFHIFSYRIWETLQYKLGALREQTVLLERLFPDGLEFPPQLFDNNSKAKTYNELGTAYKLMGLPKKSSLFYSKLIEIKQKSNDKVNLSIGLSNLSNAHLISGNIQKSISNARQALKISQIANHRFSESISLFWLGLSFAVAGKKDKSRQYLSFAKYILKKQNEIHLVGVAYALLANYSLLFYLSNDSKTFADKAWELAHKKSSERDFVRAARLQGTASVYLNEYSTADERLHHALIRARTINFVEEELPTLISLAELRRRQDRPAEARELLDDVWDAAERGPYPLFHADACNVLCQIERDAGNTAAAIEAATKAYRLAWCDGPPWSYHHGLENAKRHLVELGASFPTDNLGNAAREGLDINLPSY